MTTVMITGTNRGIGLEMVRQYAADGARVLACCRNPAAARRLKDLAAESDRRVTLHPLDVVSSRDISALKNEVGTMPIDILINNAGVSGGRGEAVDYDAWEEAFRVNTMAPYRIARTFRANLAAGNDKKLATLSSIMGSITHNTGDRMPYRTSKAAVNQAMKSLSFEFKTDRITVLMLHPGWVRTDMGGAQATLSPAESVRGLKKVIDELTLRDSGKFVDYQGREIPW